MARATKAGMRVQRYHPALDIGNVLTTTGRRQDPIPAHIRQGEADSACAMYSLAMALVILDLVKRSAVLAMAHRKYGVAADLYTMLGDSWHEGAYAPDVVEALEAMELPITVRWADGFDRGVDAFAVDSLKRAQLTLISYEAVKDHHRHVVLGVGCGGIAVGQKLTVDSLLVLDPSDDALPFASCNGILSIDKPVTFDKRRASVHWHYTTMGQSEPVKLLSAISLVRNDDSFFGRGVRSERRS
ncbi:hypothetical protein [Variovorax sp. IB41]|uniref:hypothetical protein n=1 Tax=Variovorax sp. IB41 TaxID=2779370 RepID=UPI0018E6F991|nr:hypothetical protein [Variovorax sp. IB41]MBJ2154583.1 hypothetical protein [Variovorax sp. IB41]